MRVSSIGKDPTSWQWWHNGSLGFQSGYLVITDDGKISGGQFVIDMNSIQTLDMPADEGGEDLTKHLKSDDFFSVASFPTASFNLLQANLDIGSSDPNQYSVTGFLNMKGKINQLIFPATITIQHGTVRVKGKAVIDRTQWGITYKSQNFFSSIKDGIISNDIEVEVDLVFR